MLPSLLLATLSGLLYVFAFAPWDQTYLAWPAFVPLLLAVELLPAGKRITKNLVLLGLIVGIIVSIGGFYWVIHATQEYGGLPLFAAVLLFVIFCFINQLQIPLWLILREGFLKRNLLARFPIFRAFSFAVFYAGIESIYPKLFSDTVGNAFSHAPWIRQVAALGGPFLLTVMLIATAELWFVAVRHKKWVPGIIGLALPVFALSYGSYHTAEYRKLEVAHAGDPSFKLAMIQANIGDYLKVAAEHGSFAAVLEVVGKYLDLSNQALKDPATPDAIVWPETAYPAVFQHPMSSVDMKMEGKMQEFFQTLKGHMIFGGYDADPSGVEYNSIFFYNSQEQKKQVYHKNVLLMFGETLPFADVFPSIKGWFPNMGFFGRGPGPEVYDVMNRTGDHFKLAPSICYEGLFPAISAKDAELGADALLNVTNDSWFGPNGEPDLHLALTNFRSVETGLPMLRATNTGYTVWIDPLGNFVKSTELGQTGILQAEIRKRFTPEPLYLAVSRVLGGDWFIRITWILTAIGIAFVAYKPKSLKTPKA